MSFLAKWPSPESYVAFSCAVSLDSCNLEQFSVLPCNVKILGTTRCVHPGGVSLQKMSSFLLRNHHFWRWDKPLRSKCWVSVGLKISFSPLLPYPTKPFPAGEKGTEAAFTERPPRARHCAQSFPSFKLQRNPEVEINITISQLRKLRCRELK